MERLAFEWEALFDVEGQTELERAWRVEPLSARVGKLAYRTRTIQAGPITEVEVYPVYGRQAEARARAAKSNLTPERQRRANHAAAVRRVIRLANANFTREDLSVTLTYAGDAPGWDRAQRDVRNFIRRLQRLREKRGLDKARYIYTIEDEDEGVRKRIHVHMLLSGGISREEIEACWRKGWANADRLQPTEEGLAAIARYITKAQKNRRKWCCSKGLKQPRVRVSTTKLTRRKIEKLASEIEAVWKDVLRKAYPGREPVSCEAYTSDIMEGVFIRCQLCAVEAAHLCGPGLSRTARRDPGPEKGGGDGWKASR